MGEGNLCGLTSQPYKRREKKERERSKKNEDKIVVPADKPEISKKVKVDLEVDTSVKDLGPNPYAKIIHMARAVDSWRIFPRLFLTVYIILLYKCVIWYMNLQALQWNKVG